MQSILNLRPILAVSALFTLALSVQNAAAQG
jgi:hypothetical protein